MKPLVAIAVVLVAMISTAALPAMADDVDTHAVASFQLSPDSTGRHYGYILVMNDDYLYECIMIRKRTGGTPSPLSSDQASRLFSFLAPQTVPWIINPAGENLRVRSGARFKNLMPVSGEAFHYWYHRGSYVRFRTGMDIDPLMDDAYRGTGGLDPQHRHNAYP